MGAPVTALVEAQLTASTCSPPTQGVVALQVFQPSAPAALLEASTTVESGWSSINAVDDLGLLLT